MPRRLMAIFLVVVVGLLAPALAPTGARAQAEAPLTADGARAALDEVWALVRDNFYDPTMKGVDWNAVGDRYGQQAAAADSREKLGDLINRMLRELPTSHLGFYTPADPAYYDLLTILTSGRAEALRGTPPDDLSYPGIGVFTRRIGGKTFITDLLRDFPAGQAGLRIGDEIIDVDGRPFAPIASFQGKVGLQTRIAIRRTRNGPVQHVTVVPQVITPRAAYLHAMDASARVMIAKGFSIGYVRVWTLFDKVYADALRALLLGGKLSKADALILDMRDGWGGGNPDVLQLFDRHLPSVQLIGRDGGPRQGNTRWRAPVILLINEGTRSMKEIFAYGFRKHGYGDLVGSPTAGSVLGARGFLLDEGLLVLPMFGIQVDGETLEGRGVAPTIEVPFDLRYAEGRDPQLDRAVDRLVEILAN